MKTCPFCAEQVQDAAIVCKHCGRQLARHAAASARVAPAAPAKKKTSPIVIGCLLVFIAFVGLAVVGSLINPTPRSSQPAAAARPAGPATGITMANFNRIREGMSYQEVVKILGSPGELQASNDIAGIKTVMYMWSTNHGLSNMNAMFQDGRLVQKAQFGLK